MSQLAIFESSDLATAGLTELSKFLGSPYYTIDSSLRQVRAWGKLGSTQLTISHDLVEDLWSIGFHIFTDKTSYRKNLKDVSFDLARDWLQLNAEFIMENMKQ